MLGLGNGINLEVRSVLEAHADSPLPPIRFEMVP